MSSAIIFISNFVKKDVISWFNLTSLPYNTTIYHGINKLPNLEFSRKLLISNGINFTSYILVMGNEMKHKNLSMVFNIMEKLVGTNFVVIGHHVCSQNIIGFSSGSISPELIQSLYMNATELIFPSLDEGFGLPIINFLKYGARPVHLYDNELNNELFSSEFLIQFIGYVKFFDSPDELFKNLLNNSPGVDYNLCFSRSWEDVMADSMYFIKSVLELPCDETINYREKFSIKEIFLCEMVLRYRFILKLKHKVSYVLKLIRKSLK